MRAAYFTLAASLAAIMTSAVHLEAEPANALEAEQVKITADMSKTMLGNKWKG